MLRGIHSGVSRDSDPTQSVRSAIVPSARALILCVERDPYIRELEAYFLEQAGFVVHFIENGAQALEMARSLKPAIVITEILVPGLDGLVLCHQLKATSETRHIPIVSWPGVRSAPMSGCKNNWPRRGGSRP